MRLHCIMPIRVAAILILLAGPKAGWCEVEPAVPELSLIPAKGSYSVGEYLEFEIRVDNATNHQVCLPTALGFGDGYLEFEVTDPSGERVFYSSEIVEDFQGSSTDLVFLRPGSFYGVHQRHSPLRAAGEWQFVAKYYGPRSAEFPMLYGETIASEPVAVLVTE